MNSVPSLTSIAELPMDWIGSNKGVTISRSFIESFSMYRCKSSAVSTPKLCVGEEVEFITLTFLGGCWSLMKEYSIDFKVNRFRCVLIFSSNFNDELSIEEGI